MSKSYPSRPSLSRSRAPVLFALLALGIAGLSGCKGCGAQEKQEKDTQTEDARDVSVQDDPLADAVEDAETAAISIAVGVADEARYAASNMQAANAPKKDPPAPKPKKPKPASGTIDKGKLNEIFREHRGEARDCYERRLKTNPALAGRVVLTLKIDSGGSVIYTDAVGDTLLDEDVTDCIETKSREWAFPEPDGGVAKVRKPFSFSPKR